MWGPSIVIFIGAVLSALGGLWASREQARQSDEAAELNKRLETQQQQLAKQQQTILEQNRAQQEALRQVQQGVNKLIADGKISKEDAQHLTKSI